MVLGPVPFEIQANVRKLLLSPKVHTIDGDSEGYVLKDVVSFPGTKSALGNRSLTDRSLGSWFRVCYLQLCWTLSL